MGAIIILIIIGILLFLIEFLLIPGITIAGIGGAVLTASGIYLAFERFGTRTGVIVLVFTLVSSLVLFIISLRSRTWKKAMLNTKISSNVSEDTGINNLHEGDRGVTIGRLAPTGMIRIGNNSFEAKSIAGYVDPRTPVEIVKIHASQIIVKPIK